MRWFRRSAGLAMLVVESAGAQDACSITAIGARVAGLIDGTVLEREPERRGSPARIQVRVWRCWIGSYAHGQTVSLWIDPKQPPCIQESEHPIRKGRGPLVAFDASNRLLLLSNEQEAFGLAGVVATSRHAGTRFTKEELDAAWRLGDAWSGSSIRGDPPWSGLPAGLQEFAFRFGSTHTKHELLQALRDAGKPSPAELQSLRVCLWDVDGAIQRIAAQLLRAAGAKVEDAPPERPVAEAQRQFVDSETRTPVAADFPRPTTRSIDDFARLRRFVGPRWENEGSRFVKAMGEPPRGSVEAFGPEMALLFAAAGRESAIQDLLEIRWSYESVHALWEYGGPFSRAPDPRVVDVLVSALLAADAGIPHDDTGLGARAIVEISRRLMQRSLPDQARALELFDKASPGIRNPGTKTWVRWALGVRPGPRALLALEHTDFPDVCGLSLKSWAAEYASVIPELLNEPRKHWFALALLGEEAAIDGLGRWLEDAITKGPERDGFRPTVALRRIGGPQALGELYRALGLVGPSTHGEVIRDLSLAIAALEAPANWKRLAALSTPATDPHGQILMAAMRTLAKRP